MALTWRDRPRRRDHRSARRRAKRPATVARAAQQISRRRGPIMWVSSGRRGRTAPRHEGVELLAVLRPLELLYELAESAGVIVEAAALCLQALELAPAIFLEREVAGRGEMRTRPEALRKPGEVALEERLHLVWNRISHELPDEIGERSRPEEAKAENDGGDLKDPSWRPAALGAGVPAGGLYVRGHRNISACECQQHEHASGCRQFQGADRNVFRGCLGPGLAIYWASLPCAPGRARRHAGA